MYSHSPADVLVRHDPRPVGTSNYGMRRIMLAGPHDPVQLLAVPAARRGAGRLRRGVRQLPARRLLPGPVALRRDRRSPGWTTIAVLLSRPQRRGDHAAVDAGRVRRTHAQRGQRAEHLPRVRAGLLVTVGTCWSSARSGAARRTSRLAPRRPPRHHHGPPRAARAEGLLRRRRVRDGAASGTATPSSPTPAPSSCSATRAPATSRTRSARAGGAACSARPRSWSVLRDPVAARRVQLAVQHRARAGDPAARGRRCATNLARPAAVGPGRHLGLALRLPRARSLRRPPRALVRRRSRTRPTCCSSRSCSSDPAALDGLLDDSGRGPGRGAAPPAEAVNRSEGDGAGIERRAAGNTGGVLRGERPRPERPPRPAAALVTDAWRGGHVP